MEKIYIEGDINNIRVGMCQIRLSDTILKNGDGSEAVKRNNPVVVYDTSGPYGDPAVKADYAVGLPRVRAPWYAKRKDIVRLPGADVREGTPLRAKEGKCITQMHYAKKRVVTPEMEYVAIRENQQVEALGLKSYITPDFVRKEVASGRAVIPANINHLELEPMIIGNRFLVKVNSAVSYGDKFTKADAEKIRLNCLLGSDAMMDVTEGDARSSMRGSYLRNSPVPIGAPPIYQALAKAGGDVGELSWGLYRDTLVEQLEQGVDFVSVHPAMRRKHLKMTAHRLAGIVSHAGKILAQWMELHGEENFLNVHFEEICEIAASYDAVISLGSSLRPGSVYDANDRAQFAELGEMRPLVETAWRHYVQVMVETPGHIPMNKIEPYVKELHYACRDVPFFSPGIVTSDLAFGHENIAGAIAGAQMAWHGASMIGGLKGQADIADAKRVQADLLSYKIAAHAADLAKGHPGSQVRDNALSKARHENRTKDWMNLSLSDALRK